MDDREKRHMKTKAAKPGHPPHIIRGPVRSADAHTGRPT